MSEGLTGATPLRNADFKALLATPRQVSSSTPRAGPSAFAKHRSGDAGGEKGFKKPRPRPHGRPGAKGAKKDEEDEDEGAKYRDRAKERREGVNVDFADPEQELAARGLGAGALQALSIEQSKFLGGDLAHTHLVKGLDYALLHQERQKLQESKAAKPSAAAEAAAAAQAAVLAAAPVERAEQLQFQSPLGRGVYDALFKARPHNRLLVREAFQPRRTAFVFEFQDGAGDVPTTLRRSKADCPAVQDLVSVAADAPVLERISKILSYVASAGVKGAKRSAKDSQYIRAILAGSNPGAPGDAQVHGQLVMRGQAAIAAAAAEEHAAAAGAAAAGDAPAPMEAAEPEDDIFGEAGTDYVPALPPKKPSAGAAAGQPRLGGGYFGSREHLDELQAPLSTTAGGDNAEGGELQQQQGPALGYPAPPPQQPDAAAAAAGGYYQGGAWQQQQQQQPGYGQGAYGQPPAEQPKWRVSTKPSLAAGDGDEAYAEYFPSMIDMAVAEDDEEADGKKGKKGAAAGDKDKASKAGGGGLDDMEKKLSQKLSREVQQMKGIFQDKGWGSEAAFKKGARHDRNTGIDPSVAATPARKRIRL